MRVAVIRPLEEYLGIQSDGSTEVTEIMPPEVLADDSIQGEGKDLVENRATFNFEPFKDLMKRRFLWYFEHYLSTIEKHAPDHKDCSEFLKMPFEGSGNTMDGRFRYGELGKRLVRVKEVINAETSSWAVDGMALKTRESLKATAAQRFFEQTVSHLNQKGHHHISMELVNDNPFVWQILYFGKPLTHLDGGIFKIRLSISPRFPEEQPRVKLETPIFHHRVSKDGVLCYFPKKPDDLKNHLESIAEALEEDSPPYDPRTIVHPEATRLLWGSDSDKKKYYRQLRRSASNTTEESPS